MNRNKFRTRTRWSFYRSCLFCTALVCALSPAICHAQGVASAIRGPEIDWNLPRRLTIHPKATSAPALKYTLLPPANGLVDGNAAVFYGKAIADNSYTFQSESAVAVVWSRFKELIEMPLPQLLEQKDVVSFVDKDFVYDFLRQAALCKACDWQLPIGKQPSYAIPMPEIQQMRSLARLVHLRTRIQIARGEITQAIESIQTLYAMARHAGEGPLVANMVGVAIAGMAKDAILDLIQHPEAPNLYWAATLLPDPLFDLSKVADVERNHFRLAVLFSDDDAAFNNDPQFWLQRLWESRLYWDIDWKGEIDLAADSTSGLWAFPIGLSGYSPAKEVLLNNGYEAQVVEAMPAAKVIVLAMWREADVLADDQAKLLGLPLYEAARLRATLPSNVSNLDFLKNDLSGFEFIHRAVTRTRRDVAVIRTIEALRDYTAKHGGSWPRTLDQITDFSIPSDPMTGEPFWYETGNPPEGPGIVATLRAKRVIGAYPSNFEIQVHR